MKKREMEQKEHISEHDPEGSEEDQLDDALADSFPASDPPSQTDPHKHVGKLKEHEKAPVDRK